MIRPTTVQQNAANLHWFKVRVDNIVRFVLLKHGAIKPQGLADQVHTATGDIANDRKA